LIARERFSKPIDLAKSEDITFTVSVGLQKQNERGDGLAGNLFSRPDQSAFIPMGGSKKASKNY